MRDCAQCGTPFAAVSSRARFCGAACRKRASRGKPRALTVVSDESPVVTVHDSGPLASSVEHGISRMAWLTETDRPMADLAIFIAANIDAGGQADRLGPLLMKALKELGGTPADRRSIGVEPEVKGKLAALRAARTGA